jgi:hypothetical protein
VALVIGWVVDIVGTNVFALIYFVGLIAVGRIKAEALADQDAYTKIVLGSPDIFVATMVGGLFFSVLAGYVAARVGGREELLHGALSSLACLGSDLLSFEQLTRLPLLVAVSGVVLAPAAGFLGGWLRLSAIRRRTVSQAT